jgi:hypothetical protein
MKTKKLILCASGTKEHTFSLITKEHSQEISSVFLVQQRAAWCLTSLSAIPPSKLTKESDQSDDPLGKKGISQICTSII